MPDTIDPPARDGRTGLLDSLSVRLFLITIIAILVVEFLVFLPSAANYRANWLDQRVQAARIASLALEAAPSRMVSAELSHDLLMSAEVLSVTELSDGMIEPILPATMPIDGPTRTVDLMNEGWASSIVATLETFFSEEGQLLEIKAMGISSDRMLEIVVPEEPLKRGLAAFGSRILALSLVISLTAGALIYLVLILLVVRPMQRVTDSVIQFRKNPGGWTERLAPTRRKDEIGRAHNALADMETAVSESFRQRERLALLGEAVAKINHDLRNSLATAQLASDALSASTDPRVQRAVPRLERALERAINLASETLQYGRSSTPQPKIQPVRLKDTIAEAALEALSHHQNVAVKIEIDPNLKANADPDHVHRIAANLIRNAAEAMPDGGSITVTAAQNALEFSDTGPGLPGRVRENLFRPFAASTRKDGSGLGLALSRDLARSMGGDIELVRTGPEGTVFRVNINSNGTA